MSAVMEVARTVKNIVLGLSPWVPGGRRYVCDRLLRRFIETLLDLDTAQALRKPTA
jgi:hypothetical protein